jgi:hypothetical protein
VRLQRAFAWIGDMPPDFVFVERANSLQLRTDALLAGNGDRVIVTAGPRFVPSTLPGNQSLTHTESGRARNATKWRRFVHKDDLVSVSGNWRRKRDSKTAMMRAALHR